MRMTRAIGIAALVAGLMLALAAPAFGHGIRFARSISGGFIPSDGPPFTAVTGKVSSGKAPCRRQSLVTVWKQTPGKDVDNGQRRTNDRGFFTIPAPGNQFAPGDYYLTVKRKVLANNRFHRHICPRLQTGSFTIEPAR
jgi:hypothetical protein